MAQRRRRSRYSQRRASRRAQGTQSQSMLVDLMFAAAAVGAIGMVFVLIDQSTAKKEDRQEPAAPKPQEPAAPKPQEPTKVQQQQPGPQQRAPQIPPPIPPAIPEATRRQMYASWAEKYVPILEKARSDLETLKSRWGTDEAGEAVKYERASDYLKALEEFFTRVSPVRTREQALQQINFKWQRFRREQGKKWPDASYNIMGNAWNSTMLKARVELERWEPGR